VAVLVYIHGFDCFGTLKGSRILRGSSVNEMSCYCPGGCGGNIPYISAQKGCYIQFSGCLWSSATYITVDARPKIVNAPLTLIFKMGQGAFRFLFLLYRRPIPGLWVYLTCHPPRLPKIHDQQSLTIHWPWLSGCCRACVSIHLDH